MRAYLAGDDGVLPLGVASDWLSWEEFFSGERDRKDLLLVLWIGGEFRIVSREDEKEKGSVLPANFQVCQEKLSGGVTQMIGLRQDRLDRLYAGISPRRIRTCIPYALAVRAGILMHSERSQEITLVGFRVPGHILISAYEGRQVIEERCLPWQGEARFAEEIGRSLKKIKERAGDAIPLKVLVDQEETVVPLAEMFPMIETTVFKDALPDPDVLENVRFSVNFITLDECRRVKRSAQYLRDLMAGSGVLGVLLAAGCSVFMLREQCLRVESRSRMAKETLVLEKEQLRSLARERYQGYIRSYPSVQANRMLTALISEMPLGWGLWSLRFDGGMGKPFKWIAVISGDPVFAFHAKGLWREAAVSEVSLNGKPARELVLWERGQVP